ncbi:hypothetical protein [Aquihabitans sp. McL0605]|uniref:hypothetical protein n=1 Tax=Aquihabitans sp. McL0605 TaxID=3415671 RepID=UPI003CE6A94D
MTVLGLPLLEAAIVVSVIALTPDSVENASLGWYSAVTSLAVTAQEAIVAAVPWLAAVPVLLVLTLIIGVSLNRWCIDDLWSTVAAEVGEPPWGGEDAQGIIPLLRMISNDQSISKLRSSRAALMRRAKLEEPPDPDTGLDAETVLSGVELALSAREGARSTTLRTLRDAWINAVVIGIGTIGLGVLLFMLDRGWNWGLAPWLLALPFAVLALVDFLCKSVIAQVNVWSGGALAQAQTAATTMNIVRALSVDDDSTVGGKPPI